MNGHDNVYSAIPSNSSEWLGDYGYAVKFILVKVCFMLHFPCAAFQPMTLVMIHHTGLLKQKKQARATITERCGADDNDGGWSVVMVGVPER